MVTVTQDVTRKRQAAAIPGCHWDADARAWVIDPDTASPAALAMVRRHFPEAELPDETASAGDGFRPLDLATQWAGERSVPELLPNTPADVRGRLYRYQAVDLAYLVARIEQDGGAYCGWSRGLGKTFGAIAVALELGAHKIVIVGPNSSKESVWRPEIAKWAGDRWTVFNLQGSKVRRDRTMEAFARSSDGVLLCHYEGLRLVDWSKVKGIDLVVCDEAHRLAKGGPGKAPQFYKALKKVKAGARLALSGSIVINSPEDLFGALHWLVPDRYSSKWRDWNNRFLAYTTGPWGSEFVGIKAGQLEPMQAELGGLLVVRRKEDELPDLPPRIDQTIEVELSGEQKRVYDELAERFIADLPDGSQIMAPTVLAQLTKLRQVATGLDLLGETMNDSAKIDLAADMVKDNLPNKTVVFAWHRATVYAFERAMEAAGIPCHAITGDTKEKDRATMVADFQTNPDTKVIVATIKTLGEAVTLHAASDLIFLESSWTPTDMEQAADRVYRIGQKSHVCITHIVAKDTVDTIRILPIVKSKDEMRRLVLGGAL